MIKETNNHLLGLKCLFVYFKYNDEEQPLIKFVKSLVDDYDRNKSDNSNSRGIYLILLINKKLRWY